MDKTAETVLCIIAAVALVAITVWVTRLKSRGLTRVAINSIAGGALIAGLSAFNIIVLPFNFLSAALVGVLGLPGAGIVIAASFIL